MGHARPRALAAHKVHGEAGGRKARRVLVVVREAQRSIHDLALQVGLKILQVEVFRVYRAMVLMLHSPSHSSGMLRAGIIARCTWRHAWEAASLGILQCT